MENKYFVYRYLNEKNEIIYVGLTTRPLKHRVKEHKVEELNKETKKIQYIILPNESQMHQREWYYIDAYKPKYNLRDVHEGKPEIMPEYDAKWIDYPMGNRTKEIEWMVDTIFDNFFNEERFSFYIYINARRKSIGTLPDTNRIIMMNNTQQYEITVNESDMFNNDKRMLLDILLQIVQYIAIRDGVKTCSNRTTYINKRIKSYCDKYGIVLEKGRYGYRPINCDDKYVNELSQYEFGNQNIDIYVNNTRRHTNSHHIKYQCESCKCSFRATKRINVVCADCNKPYIIKKECRY